MRRGTWGAPGWLIVLCSSAALGGLPGQKVAERKTTLADFNVPLERFVTPNGVTVLLSPDPTVHQVVVEMSFAAGAIYQPAAKSGLAHLVEHVMASGDAPEVDYRAMLESRGAIDFNAFTGFERMSFRVVMPPEELPLALWVAADRLGTLPGRLDDAAVRRNREIVGQEQLLRLDAAYGPTHVATMMRLFPASHPLHFGIIGTTASVASMTLDDVRAFAGEYLVPANSILTVTGSFEPATAREWVEKTVATLPPGRPAAPVTSLPQLVEKRSTSVVETTARRPRVTLAWALNDVLPESASALTLGALLVTAYDGFLGMTVNAGFERVGRGGVFVLEVTMPGGTDTVEAQNNTEVVLRFMTMAMMPADLVASTAHALDRAYMAIASSPVALAGFLTQLEAHPLPVGTPPLQEHPWLLTPIKIQQFSSTALKGPALKVQSKPARPLPRREP